MKNGMTRGVLGFGFLFAVFWAGGVWAERTEPLPPERVFQFSAEGAGGENARAVYRMIPDAYLYRERIAVTVVGGGELRRTVLAEGQIKDDPFFGRTRVFYSAATVAVQLPEGAAGDARLSLAFVSQGCDEQIGICYPPRRDVAVFALRGGEWDAVEVFVNAGSDDTGGGATVGVVGGEYDDGFGGGSGGGFGGDEKAAEFIAGSGLLFLALAFFGFGLLLSFTPCVLPMLPVLLGILGAAGGGRGRTFALTLSYVGGVCAAFTGLGVFVGWTGALVGIALQRPPMLIAAAAAVVLLSLSMFGVYNFQPPGFVRNWAAKRGKSGGGMTGTFAAGALSAAILSPCVAAPLAGALLYIGSTGDAGRGALALFSLSLGMSAILLAAGAGAGALLPKAGEWMNAVKNIAGLFLLALAVWIVSPLVAAEWRVFGYALLLFAGGVLLFRGAGGNKFISVAGALFAVYGLLAAVSAASGGRDLFRPFSHFSQTQSAVAPLEWQTIRSLPVLRAALADAGGKAEEAMVVVYAEWCVSCREFEELTLADARVRERLAGAVLLRADVTEDSADARELLRHFRLFGPPAALFYGGVSRARFVGYLDADDFLEGLPPRNAAATIRGISARD